MFKAIDKNNDTNWDDLSRQVYGLPDKAGCLKKINANIDSGEILAPVADNQTESGNIGVRVEIGEDVYSDFAEYDLIDEIGSVRGAVFTFVATDGRYNFDFKNEIKVYNEDGLFLTGRIANIIPHVTQSAKWTQIEIKSHAGILLESVCPYPLEYSNLSLRAILQNIAEDFGQVITFSDTPELDEVCVNEIGTSFTAGVQEKIFSFMMRLCKSRGLVLKDTGSGLFVGRLDESVKEKICFIAGECVGVKEWHAFFNTDGLGRYYEINSQYPDTRSAVAQVPFPYPITKRLSSNDYNANDLNSVADNKACEDIGEHFKVVLRLSEEKRELKTGDIAIIKNPDIYIDEETEFVIKKVIPLDNDETEIVFVLPCAYTGKMPESLPLCT